MDFVEVKIKDGGNLASSSLSHYLLFQVESAAHISDSPLTHQEWRVFQ